MYDNVPIVPNLYEAPANPSLKDCYYNVTEDKYYIYDGTNWIEAKTADDPSIAQDTFYLRYSTDNGTTFTTETYTDFNALCAQTNSATLKSATDVMITMSIYPAILVPRAVNSQSLDTIALLKFKTKTSGTKDVFTLKYSTNGGSSYTTETYDYFSDLVARTNSSAMSNVTDIEISMQTIEDPNVSVYQEEVVGKIYPKIIFNKKIVQNLKMNTHDTNTGMFDNVLVFYKTN